MVTPDLLRCDGREADPVGDGAGIPGFTDAEAIHLTDLHIGHHLGRRNGDQGDIFVRVDPTGREPIAIPHGMEKSMQVPEHPAKSRLTRHPGTTTIRLLTLGLGRSGLGRSHENVRCTVFYRLLPDIVWDCSCRLRLPRPECRSRPDPSRLRR